MRRVKGWGLGGVIPSPFGGLGAYPRKKINFALKIMQFWASFGTSFLYYSIRTYLRIRESGGIILPVLKVGDLSPCSNAYA